ncbi:MAG TPA: anti-sigma factor [Geminicoccus sp.]|jgi:anti-sigma-K factor RskA|uniref:anti-sigma factor n=1 Tax=Geminicoccus sp. TaxID=2024832 RepID=UPI002E309976|nr:anti-sigma factor [Geminicoccus sp.]HEX2529114.1 anti-sigma factor [Geminicoccus sp.]
MSDLPSDRDDLDADAGEYVLGTLSPEDHMRFEMRLRTDRQAQAAVAYWERRLSPLAGLAAPAEPDPQLFGRIEQTINRQARPARPGRVLVPARTRIWNNVTIWRNAALAAGLAAAAFAGLLLIRPLPQGGGPSYVAVLDNAEGAPVWLVTADPANLTISVDPVGQSPNDSRVPELWLIPEGTDTPISLGVLGGHRTTAVIDADRLAQIGEGAVLAVSLEPPGGSPTGTPTGPVVQQGRIVPYLP